MMKLSKLVFAMAKLYLSKNEIDEFACERNVSWGCCLGGAYFLVNSETLSAYSGVMKLMNL